MSIQQRCMHLRCYVALNKSLNKCSVEKVFGKLRERFATNARQLGAFLFHQPAITQQQRQANVSSNENKQTVNDNRWTESLWHLCVCLDFSSGPQAATVLTTVSTGTWLNWTLVASSTCSGRKPSVINGVMLFVRARRLSCCPTDSANKQKVDTHM